MRIFPKCSFLLYLWIYFTFVKDSLGASDVIVLHTEEFDQRVSKGGWLVEFYAPWCGFCRRFAPIYEEVATELKDSVHVATVDATEERGLAARFHITGYPTIYYIQGESVYQLSGSRSKDGLVYFATQGWKKEQPLGILKSPFSVIGKTKGSVIRLGLRIYKLHEVMVNEYNIPSAASYGILGATGILLTLLSGMLITWLIMSKDKQD